MFLQYELQYERGQNFWVASFFGVLLSITLGVLTHWVILRPLQRKRASNLIQLLATLGVLVTVQAGVVIRYGSKPRQVPSQLPVDRVTLYGDVSITVDRLILLAIGSFSAFLFWPLYRTSMVSKPRRFQRMNVLRQPGCLAKQNCCSQLGPRFCFRMYWWDPRGPSDDPASDVDDSLVLAALGAALIADQITRWRRSGYLLGMGQTLINRFWISKAPASHCHS